MVAGGQAFVGPDNGVLVPVTTALGLTDAREIQHPDLRADQISHTFHGRDVFGPTAGALAGGFSVPDVGVQVQLLPLQGAVPEPIVGAEVVTGHVEAVDHFGNILTTIPKTLLPATPFRVEIGQRSICCHVHSYGEMTPGHGESGL